MKAELDEKLCKKYPKIFVQRNLPMDQTCMCWGFECGDGWYWLIDMLCNTIQRYVDDNNAPQPEAIQVKEKYGGLRFYVSNTSDLVEGMIWLAEELSKYICEVCGKKGKQRNPGGWISTRCDKCFEEREKV